MSRPLLTRRLVTCSAGLAVVLGGGILLWGRTLREYWSLLEDVRSPAGPATAPAEGRSQQVRLAFLAPDGRTLEEEARDVVLRPSVSAAAHAVLEELRAGSRRGRGAVLPPGVRVGHVFVDKRGVAYVDLSAEILGAEHETGLSVPAVRAAQAIAASLGMSLPEIAQVQILVEGRELPLVADGVDLRRPLPASLPLRRPEPA